jgi:hypothetical protein
MQGASFTSWPGAETLADIDGYKQEQEKEYYYRIDEWQPVEPPKGFVRIISV